MLDFFVTDTRRTAHHCTVERQRQDSDAHAKCHRTAGRRIQGRESDRCHLPDGEWVKEIEDTALHQMLMIGGTVVPAFTFTHLAGESASIRETAP